MSVYRSSTGNLAHYDEGPRGGSSSGGGGGGAGERWDRDRFERMRGRGGAGGGGGGGGGRDEHEHYRFQEHDRFPGGRRDIDVHEDIDRRGPRVMERERFREEDRFDRPSRSRTDFFNESTPSEVANKALAPYRRKSVMVEDIDYAPRKPARPQYMRRQSSLDTFDRRPLPRYNEFEKEEREWRPPTNVPIPLPIRQRRLSPPRYEEEFEEVRYTDREPRRGRETEEYHEIEVSRAKSTRRRSPSHASRSVAAKSVRSSSTSSFEEVTFSRANWGKKGKTRLPKRLCKTQAIVELGYPYEEEDDFVVIQRALEKDHIDEIIKFSESYKEMKTTYVYENKTEILEAPPPPPPVIFAAPPPPASVVFAAPPPPPSVMHAPPLVMHAPPPPQSHYAQSVRSISPPRHERYEEHIEESNHIGGPLTVLVPEERRQIIHTEREYRSERDIKDEIRALESERRMLKYERDSDYEIVERRDPRREVVRVEKDRKGRRKTNPKLVAAAMATLS